MGPVGSIWLSAITVWTKLLSPSIFYDSVSLKKALPTQGHQTSTPSTLPRGSASATCRPSIRRFFLEQFSHGRSPGLWPFAVLADITFRVFAPSTRTSSLKLECGCKWHAACYVSWKHFAFDAARHCLAGQRTFCRMFGGPSQRSSRSIIQSTKFTKAWVSILIERNPSPRERILLDVFELWRWPSKFDRKRIHSNPHLSSLSSTERGSIQTIASPLFYRCRGAHLRSRSLHCYSYLFPTLVAVL